MSINSLPAVVELPALGDLAQKPIAHGGQCVGIWGVPETPGILFKRYTDEARRDMNPSSLDRLIGQPRSMTGDEQRLVRTATAWPTSRVVEGSRTIGILMPRAPTGLSFVWHSPRARTDGERNRPLEIDLLAKPNQFLLDRRIPSQSAADRIVVCARLAQVGALFEKYGIVYADWSYANAFWHPVSHAVFLLDVDGSSFGPRQHVATPNFDDPLTPPGTNVDSYTDRYRAALLIGRCLTAQRDVDTVVSALRGMAGVVPGTLVRMLTAAARSERPRLADLVAAFAGSLAPNHSVQSVNATGVVRWKKAPKLAASRGGTPRAGASLTGSRWPTPAHPATNSGNRIRPVKQPVSSTPTGRVQVAGTSTGKAPSSSGNGTPPVRSASANPPDSTSGQTNAPSTGATILGALVILLGLLAIVICCGYSILR